MRAALALAVAALTLAAPAASAQGPPTCPGSDVAVAKDREAAKAAVLCITNVERAVRGLPPVTGEGRLDIAAQGHSQDMADRNFFAHDTPEGRTPADRVGATGYPWSVVLENIAAGQPTARVVMTAWLRSIDHCHGFLAPEPAHLGIGIVQRSSQGPIWTQNFGLTQDMAPPSQDTGPAAGCPYQRLAIAPGPARVLLTRLQRLGRQLAVEGLLRDEDGGLPIVISCQRKGKTAKKTTRTVAGGSFRTSMRCPAGNGRVKVTATATRVEGLYEKGSDSRRI